ncbi:hypothetical protein Trydic_g5001 [Trypoxylus dichotomus]
MDNEREPRRMWKPNIAINTRKGRPEQTWDNVIAKVGDSTSEVEELCRALEKSFILSSRNNPNRSAQVPVIENSDVALSEIKLPLFGKLSEFL